MDPPSYEQAAAANDTARTEQESGIIDRRYLSFKGIPGILKLLECVFSLIGFICIQAAGVICAPWLAVTGFFSFVSMASFTLTLALYFILLFKLQRRIFRCDCVNWPLVETCYYSGVCLFFFFGALFIGIQGCHGGHKAASAFGFFALAVFIVDLVFAVRSFIASRKAGGDSTANVGGASSYEGQKY